MAAMLQRGSLVGVPLGARRGSLLLDGSATIAALQVPPQPRACFMSGVVS